MMSSAKRLCSSSSMIKHHWHPIVDDEYLSLPNLESMIVGRVKDRRSTSDILLLIDEIYPWPPRLKHVRRIHRTDDYLDILLYPSDFTKPLEKNLLQKYFDDQTRLTNIPENPCALKWQYEKCIKEHWPNLTFKHNHFLEKAQLNKPLTEQDDLVLDLLEKIQENKKESHCGIIVDNESGIPLVGAGDYRDEHPLQHCSMIAIDLLASNSIYSRENLLEKYLEKKKEKKSYLLNGCSIYLSHEPCIMCAMALLHSRISTVYYCNSNRTFGALGSIYKLHTLKRTNHRFTVYQLEEEKTETEKSFQ